MENENLRFVSCDLIQNAGILLKLPQAAMTTAQMLLQRVYRIPDYTFDDYPMDITAMASLFLAAKIEECPRKAREVMDTFAFVISDKLNKNITLDYREHEKLREELITAERMLLKKLGFDLLNNSPHRIIVSYYHAIVNFLDPEHNVWTERDNRRVLQTAWNYCNDSLRTDLFIRFSREVVACACIQMACEDNKMVFPDSTDGREWYLLFVGDKNEVRMAINVIRELYNRCDVDIRKFRRYIQLDKLDLTG